jgi:hypothetical protein
VSVDVLDQHRTGGIHTISKLQNAFSSSKISTIQNSSQPSNEFHTDDQKSQENVGSTSHSDRELYENLSLNISVNSKRKTSYLDSTNHMKTASNSSTGEHLLCKHNDEEREMVLKVTQEKYKVMSSNILLHNIPERNIVGGNPRRIDCTAVVSQGIVQFLNDEQWMETLLKTAVVLHQQVKPLVIVYIVGKTNLHIWGLHLFLNFIGT